METLLSSCRAAPTLLATVVFAEESPSAPLCVMRRAPPEMLMTPPQMSLLAARTSVPRSFLVKPLLAKPKAELIVQVVPLATSRTLFATVLLLKTIVRLVEMLFDDAPTPTTAAPVARRVAGFVPFRMMLLVPAPRAVSLVKARVPRVTWMFAVKVLPELLSSIVPAPVLVQTPDPGVPETTPLNSRLGTTLEVVAPLLPTSNVV